MNRGFWYALGIVALATAAGIASGIRNQSGTGGLWLEVGRELQLLTGDPENTERALVWVIPRPAGNRVTIDGRRPADLGLTPDSGEQSLARPRFVVLTLLEGPVASASRLAITDAGPELAGLAERYPDRGRYLIVQGTIARWRPGGREGTSFYVWLVPVQLHLPTELPLGRALLVRSGRRGVPFIADSRP
jgi:hypothetical protein